MRYEKISSIDTSLYSQHPLKIARAVRAEVPPILDGRLDDGAFEGVDVALDPVPLLGSGGGLAGGDQGDEHKRTIDEASKLSGRRQNQGLERLLGKVWAEPAYGPVGVRRTGGVTLIQALMWNVGTCRPDAKGAAQVGSPTSARVPMRDTGAEYPRSSDEGPVMGLERRGVPHPAFRFGTTGSPGGSLGGRQRR